MSRCVLLLLLTLPGWAVAQSPFVEDPTSPLATEVQRSLGASWGDYDDDGDLDLVVANINQSSIDDLFRNEGGGAFTRIAFETDEDPRAETNTGVWADIDNDGDLDLVTTSLSGGSVLRNDGSVGGTPNFTFLNTRLGTYTGARDGPMADYDGDGWLDVAVLIRYSQSNVLLRNTGGSDFEVISSGEVDDTQNDASVACWGDPNSDGWPDLYVTNASYDDNEFYLNVHGTLRQRFVHSSLSDGGRGSGCAWGDYDGDADLDLFVTNAIDGINRLFRNDGTKPFRVDSGPGGGPPGDSFGGGNWGDVDNDGDLDLVVLRRNSEDTLYLNDGSGNFTAVPFGSASDGIASANTLVDDDQDGDLDLFVTYGSYNEFQRNRLYRNTTNGAGNWLAVDLRRASGGNRFGIGAHVYAHATIEGTPRVLLREVVTRSNRMAQNGNRLHFGLGDAATVDSLVVEWPRGVSGQRTVLYEVPANQIIEIGEVGEVTVSREHSGEAPASSGLLAVYPNPSVHEVTVAWRAAETEEVVVEVFDVLGRRVDVVRRTARAGQTVELRWNGTDAPGRYLLRVRAGNQVEAVPVTILR